MAGTKETTLMMTQNPTYTPFSTEWTNSGKQFSQFADKKVNLNNGVNPSKGKW